jgi:hypothetical protein
MGYYPEWTPNSNIFVLCWTPTQLYSLFRGTSSTPSQENVPPYFGGGLWRHGLRILEISTGNRVTNMLQRYVWIYHSRRKWTLVVQDRTPMLLLFTLQKLYGLEWCLRRTTKLQAIIHHKKLQKLSFGRLHLFFYKSTYLNMWNQTISHILSTLLILVDPLFQSTSTHFSLKRLPFIFVLISFKNWFLLYFFLYTLSLYTILTHGSSVERTNDFL